MFKMGLELETRNQCSLPGPEALYEASHNDTQSTYPCSGRIQAGLLAPSCSHGLISSLPLGFCSPCRGEKINFPAPQSTNSYMEWCHFSFTPHLEFRIVVSKRARAKDAAATISSWYWGHIVCISIGERCWGSSGRGHTIYSTKSAACGVYELLTTA